MNIKINGLIISMRNSIVGRMVFGLIIMVSLLTLPVLTICIFSGQKLMWVLLSLENLTDYSIYIGKLAKQIKDATECVTSKTVVLDSLSWHPEKL